MIKHLLLAFCALIFSAPAFASAVVGQPAPAFTATDSNGNTVNLEDFKGKLVVLEWTNDGCPFVKKHYETNNIQKLQKKYTDEGVVWLSVISSAEGKQGYVTGEQANALTTSREASPTAVILDPKGELGQLYGAKTTPHMYVVDKEGTLVYAGAIDDNDSMRQSTVETAKNYVSSTLDALMAGSAVEVAETQAYGCSVKY